GAGWFLRGLGREWARMGAFFGFAVWLGFEFNLSGYSDMALWMGENIVLTIFVLQCYTNILLLYHD
ncbi:MAG: hypothetical protein K2H21_07085, partial [Muribaculaceae bacterium]|nr:hypothetical protein [Muribaculaceae bacterium]